MRHALFAAMLLLFLGFTAHATIGPVLAAVNAVNYGTGNSQDLVVYNGKGYVANGSGV